MNRKRNLMLLMLGMAVIVAAGCGGTGKLEAAAINEDVDKCETCNMQVHDDEFATQLITEEGKVYKFDDLGCMNEWKEKNAAADIAIQFVRDHGSREWVKLDNAYFAYDPSFQSPMAYGIVSFKDQAAAEQYIHEQGKGKLMSAAELSAHTWERGSMHMDAHHGDDAHGESSTKGSHE